MRHSYQGDDILVDIVDSATRSRMMSGIQGKNTKPEVFVRKIIHAAGFRFRLHRKDLPGKPDIVLPRHKIVIQVHGCFWHGHNNCHLFRTPQSRSEFWHAKINENRERDKKTTEELIILGWRVLVIWECATKGKNAIPPISIASKISEFILNSNHPLKEIKGKH